MLRWAGALLILCGGLLARHTLLEGERRTRRTRRALIGALEAMEAEIRLLLTPVPVLLRRSYDEEAGDFFSSVSRELERGVPLGAAWRSSCGMLPLPEEERDGVAALGARLDGGEESVCAALELAAAALRRADSGSEAKRPERERLVTTICVSMSLLLLILLL